MPSLSLVQYHLLHGPARLVNALRESHWKCEAQIAPWTKEVLSGCDVIYINLVSADRPPFTVDEVLAIEEFVRNGGGLFVVTDHTNCYFHNHVLGSLADRLDIELTNELLCDRAPHTTGPGNAWVVLDSFREHPITRGLQRVAIQSGGCVDSRYGIIQSSDKSWGDWANIPSYGSANSPGFYGDFQQQPIERTGPLSAVAAKDFGKGRIVVLGDQNCVGGVFLNYLDNRRLAIQMFYWLANRECDESVIVSNREKDRSLVVCLEKANGEESQYGNSDDAGLYHLFAWLGKVADARATDREKDWMDAELLVLSCEKESFAKQTLTQLQQFLAQPSKTALVLDGTALSKTPDALDSLTRGFIAGKKEKLGELSYSEWYNAGGSKLFICNNVSGWGNKQFPAPEVTMNATQHSLTNNLARLLTQLGVRNVTSNTKHWLEERDE
jgi:hypothetical protein